MTNKEAQHRLNTADTDESSDGSSRGVGLAILAASALLMLWVIAQVVQA